MDFTAIPRALGTSSANLLKTQTASEQSFLRRQIASRIIYATVAQSLALVGVVYHALATLAKVFPATLKVTLNTAPFAATQKLAKSIPDYMGWQHIGGKHLRPLTASVRGAVVTPFKSLLVDTKSFKERLNELTSELYPAKPESRWRRYALIFAKYAVPAGVLGALVWYNWNAFRLGCVFKGGVYNKSIERGEQTCEWTVNGKPQFSSLQHFS